MKNRSLKILIVIISLSTGLIAQQRMQPLGGQSKVQEEVAEEKEGLPEYEGMSLLNTNIGWEGPITEDYIIGPGDVFSVSILSMEQAFYQVPVGPDGSIHLPGTGKADVKDMTLNQAVSHIQSLIKLQYPKAKISVSLSQIKRLNIPITGALEAPGVVTIFANTRLSDILMRHRMKPMARLYAVQIHHNNGQIDTINVIHHRMTGNMDDNPMLLMGDRIYIPYGNIEEDIVHVTGEKEFQSLMAVEPGTTLETFIQGYISYTSNLKISGVTIIRDGERFDIRPDSYTSYRLKGGDIISLYRNEPVSVVGFVHIPGSYPYYPNFTVNDYISLAGGISREGSLKSIKILRSDGSSDSDLNSHLNPGDVIEVKRSFSDFLVGDINVLSVITTTASLILTWIAATK
ncbi:MAG: hypothetical protein PWP06_1633 [Candidatus Marinimicrobia bacterium]|nr:hypothetical protein [Candidatus Neomarinimicrobiota bacterium]